MRTRLLMVFAPMVLTSWTTSSSRNMTSKRDIVALESERMVTG